MKRLLRKAELIDTQVCEDGGNTNLYKNPTEEEINKALDSGCGEIRGLITPSEVYVWKGTSLHFSAGKAFGLDILSAENLRFAYDDCYGWIFDCGNQRTLGNTIIMINKNSNELSKYGDLNNNIEIYNSSDFDDIDGTKYHKNNAFDVVYFENSKDMNNFIND